MRRGTAPAEEIRANPISRHRDNMRLSDVITREMEGILADFEDFARTHTTAGGSMDVEALRDHAEEMLRAFVVDMSTAQSEAEQQQKSFGDSPAVPGSPVTAASEHGHARAGSGFTLEEMFAEYRALRASVLRHWTSQSGISHDDSVSDMIRFNEAIDQAVAESITRYTTTLGENREMFIGVLGHDLRTPLSAILTAAEYLSDEQCLDDRSRTLVRTVIRSGTRMNDLVKDLLDFTLARLGRGIPIEPHRANMETIVRESVEELRLINPGREFRLETVGDLAGEWDQQRITQAISNLVANALQHGTPASAITIVARPEDDMVLVAVRNRGAAIRDADLAHIFEPYTRKGSLHQEHVAGRSVGLGLYIARQVAIAHHGTIDVDSSAERGTTFTLRLPRRAAPPRAPDQPSSPPARLRASDR